MSINEQQTSIEIQPSDDGEHLFAVVTAGVDPPEIGPQWLDATLAMHGFAGARVLDNALLSLQRLVASRGSGRIEIAVCLDAEIKTQISKDQLEASVTLNTARGGRSATYDQVLEAVRALGVAPSCINADAIKQLLEQAARAAPGASLRAVVAVGRAPVHGKHSRFEALVRISDRRPRARADGTLDYRDLGAITTVAEGEALMRRHPPTAGVAGLSVTGEPLPAKDGQDRGFKNHKGAAVAANDPDLLIATRTGQPVIESHGVTVDPVFTVEDVNLRTGHILYDGTLVVRGNVLPGMRVEVTGDVLVSGTVESADIQAGGNVHVKMGIVGLPDERNKDGHIMRVRCGGNLSAGYIDYAHIETGGDLTVKSLVAHSDISVRTQAAIGSSGEPRSGIVGGVLRAATLIRTESLGVEAGIKTRVELMGDIQVLKRFDEVQGAIAAKESELGQLLKVMVAIAKSPKSPATEERAQRINVTCEAMKQDIRALITERDQLQAAIDRFEQGRIEIHGTLFPGVSVGFMGQTIDVRQRGDHVAVVYHQGHIRIQKEKGT